MLQPPSWLLLLQLLLVQPLPAIPVADTAALPAAAAPATDPAAAVATDGDGDELCQASGMTREQASRSQPALVEEKGSSGQVALTLIPQLLLLLQPAAPTVSAPAQTAPTAAAFSLPLHAPQSANAYMDHPNLCIEWVTVPINKAQQFPFLEGAWAIESNKVYPALTTNLYRGSSPLCEAVVHGCTYFWVLGWVRRGSGRTYICNIFESALAWRPLTHQPASKSSAQRYGVKSSGRTL